MQNSVYSTAGTTILGSACFAPSSSRGLCRLEFTQVEVMCWLSLSWCYFAPPRPRQLLCLVQVTRLVVSN